MSETRGGETSRKPAVALRSDTLASLSAAGSGADLGLDVPVYDRPGLKRSILHFGVGGFHRSHLAVYIDDLCRAGNRDWSIVGVGILPGDRAMAEVMEKQDCLYALMVRGPDRTTTRIVGSIVEYIHAHPDPTPAIERVADPDIEMISLTITEGGYPVDDRTGIYDPDSPVAGATSAFGLLAAGLQLRRQRGVAPLSVVSCDNIVSNGAFTRAATVGEAERIEPDLARWIDEHVAFPNSMVDRITPATTDDDRRHLAEATGVVDQWPVATEPFTQWVLEDSFAGRRPPVEQLGVILTADVEPYERMKLRLLNAGHSCLAYLSAIAGIEYVDRAMADDAIRRYVEAFLELEAAPVLPPVNGIDLAQYQRSLIERFSNPAISDQIARLCLDGSAKFPKFLLPTVRAQLASDGPISLSALALAGWCLYLQGHSETGQQIVQSPDPDLETAMAYAAESVDQPERFLAYEAVFGQDLPNDRRFVAAFVDAITALRATGVASSIHSTLGPVGG